MYQLNNDINVFQLIENECFKFEEQICDFEDDSTNPAVPDDIRDSILAAIGKARLLMAQKLAQFRGLCVKNVVRFSFFDIRAKAAQSRKSAIFSVKPRITSRYFIWMFLSFTDSNSSRRSLRSYPRGPCWVLGHGLYPGGTHQRPLHRVDKN